ncbi:hypothetical protein AGMMS50229_03180 [Campylobacterota bacterium]|nr:hypothetical protein AGMMS50229_03180 [Campylobacterota bacterium]
MKRLLIRRNIKKQQRIYSALFAHYNDRLESLHWSTYESQVTRFEQFLKVGDLNGAKVLDIGCGFGDFYGFLQQHKISTRYLGVDITSQFIGVAQKRYLSARFWHRDILTLPISESFDYVFASGVFAFGSQLFFQELSRAAYRLANVAWVFNLYEPSGKDSRFFAIKRAETEAFLLSLQPQKICMIDNYLERDLTYIVYKVYRQ